MVWESIRMKAQIHNRQLDEGGKAMAKKVWRLFVAVLVLALMAGCATQKASPVVKAGDLNMKMQSGQYIQNANNFEIIFDKSGSMGSDYAGVQKFVIEKSLVSKFNSYIPDLNLNGGLRTFGQNYADFDVTKLDIAVSSARASPFTETPHCPALTI
jgi:OOP family OmpA-OmpF porin